MATRCWSSTRCGGLPANWETARASSTRSRRRARTSRRCPTRTCSAKRCPTPALAKPGMAGRATRSATSVSPDPSNARRPRNRQFWRRREQSFFLPQLLLYTRQKEFAAIRAPHCFLPQLLLYTRQKESAAKRAPQCFLPQLLLYTRQKESAAKRAPQTRR
jgi:hypothetical protein